MTFDVHISNHAVIDFFLWGSTTVNRNLVGTGYMSTDQKKKLLWGSKKKTVAEEVFL